MLLQEHQDVQAVAFHPILLRPLSSDVAQTRARHRGYAPHGESVEEEPIEEMRERAARRIEKARAAYRNVGHPTMMSHAEGEEAEGGAAKELADSAQKSWFGRVSHEQHARANVEGVPADMREAMDTSQVFAIIHDHPHRERLFIELMTLDRKLQASREGTK